MIEGSRAVVPNLNERAIRAFILNHFSSANLLVDPEEIQDAPDHMFESNDDFWLAVKSSSASALSWIELPSFHLCDWFPRSPGLFHTMGAQSQRRRAKRHLERGPGGELLYRPEGKSDMIAGGIGSVRFQPIKIDGSDHWLCTATSDYYCHSGIPLAIPHTIYKNLNILEAGNFRIFGQLRFLPPFLSDNFSHRTHSRQLYIQVAEIRRLDSTGSSVIVTPMVFFTADGEYGRESRVTFVQCAATEDSELDSAAEWIEGYVDRFGKRILTNFDQQRPTFAEVPFSLQAVMSNTVDFASVDTLHIEHASFIQSEIKRIFVQRVDMSKSISVTLGDGTVVHGDIVVANSINDSFNRAVEADSPDDVKLTLQQLSAAVGKLVESLDQEKAEEVARDLEALTSEATSAKPRKKWWQLSADGLKEAAESVAGVGKPVIDVLSKLLPLLSKIN